MTLEQRIQEIESEHKRITSQLQQRKYKRAADYSDTLLESIARDLKYQKNIPNPTIYDILFDAIGSHYFAGNKDEAQRKLDLAKEFIKERKTQTKEDEVRFWQDLMQKDILYDTSALYPVAPTHKIIPRPKTAAYATNHAAAIQLEQYADAYHKSLA